MSNNFLSYVKRNKAVKAQLVVAVILMVVIIGLAIYSEYQAYYLLSTVPQCGALPANELVTETPIKHVIIIFLENHSFDNFFGVYPNNLSISNPLVTQLTIPINLLTLSNVSNHLEPVPANVFTTKDPNEGFVPYHADWNYGRMNGWVQGSGPQSLYYYTVDQLGPLWDLAEEYGVADNYFTPFLSESAPNHLYLYAAFSPVIDDYGPPPYVPVQESIFAELCEYHVSWGYYVNPSEPHKLLDINYFYGIDKYESHIQTWSDFINEVRNGSLPAVAWVLPDPNTDMGPPADVLTGEEWLLYIINTVMNSPIWNSTVIFITWDEFGGYYDQVPPPMVGGKPLGLRVPLLVISPYAKEDYISHTLLTHASLIAFIDYNWELPALNYYVANSNIPLDFFYFNYTRPPIELQGFPIPTSIYPPYNISVTSSELAGLYPMVPQMQFNELPYSRYGVSNITLLKLGFSVYVSSDWPYTPIVFSSWFQWLIILLIVDILVMLSYSSGAVGRSFLNTLTMKVLSVITGSITTASIMGLITVTVGFIDYLGNTGEALPLILGYLIGLILFSLIGLFLIRSRASLYTTVAVSILIPLLLYLLFYEQTVLHYLMSDLPFLIYGILSTAPSIIIMYLLFRDYIKGASWFSSVKYALIPSIISFLLIIIIAREYIALYQPGLTTLMLPMEIINLVLVVALMIIVGTRVRVEDYGR